MTTREAQQYHSEQIRTFSQTEADLVSAFTINYVEEAIGIIRANASSKSHAELDEATEFDAGTPQQVGNL